MPPSPSSFRLFLFPPHHHYPNPHHAMVLRPQRRAALSCSDSVPSEESDSIYNALRASSVTDNSAHKYLYATAQTDDFILDSQLAANMAMLTPLTPAFTTPHNQFNSALWHSHFDQLRHRKAMSLNDADDPWRVPTWLVTSPVSPVLPKYPPPVRSPTPPGLPSFGTREAVCYSAQFLVQSSSVDGQQGHVYNASYGQSLRRFFGFSSTVSPPSSEHMVHGIGRAEDGTVVQGRFPYRQSGHGMNVARQLEDHPFHRINLPVALNDRGQSNRSRKIAAAVCPQRTSTVHLLPEGAHQSQDHSSQSQHRLTAGADHDGFCLPDFGANGGRYPSALQSSFSAAMQSSNFVSEQSPDGRKPTNLWASPWAIVHSYLCCCLEDESDEDNMAIELSSSNDTYATARSWNEGNNVNNEGETSHVTCVVSHQSAQSTSR